MNPIEQAKGEVLDAIETLADFANDRAVAVDLLDAASLALIFVQSEREA